MPCLFMPLSLKFLLNPLQSYHTRKYCLNNIRGTSNTIIFGAATSVADMRLKSHPLFLAYYSPTNKLVFSVYLLGSNNGIEGYFCNTPVMVMKNGSIYRWCMFGKKKMGLIGLHAKGETRWKGNAVILLQQLRRSLFS